MKNQINNSIKLFLLAIFFVSLSSCNVYEDASDSTICPCVISKVEVSGELNHVIYIITVKGENSVTGGTNYFVFKSTTIHQMGDTIQ